MRLSRIVMYRGASAYGHPPVRLWMDKALGLSEQGYSFTSRKKHPPHFEAVDLSAWDADSSRQMNLMLLQAWPSFLLLQTADLVQNSLPSELSPDFQFLRHVRNAIAHNGRFNIRSIKRPAIFDNYEITQELHGTPLEDFLEAGDLLALLDHIERRLRYDFLPGLEAEESGNLPPGSGVPVELGPVRRADSDRRASQRRD